MSQIPLIPICTVLILHKRSYAVFLLTVHKQVSMLPHWSGDAGQDQTGSEQEEAFSPIVCLGSGTPHKPAVLTRTGHVLHEASACAEHLAMQVHDCIRPASAMLCHQEKAQDVPRVHPFTYEAGRPLLPAAAGLS